MPHAPAHYTALAEANRRRSVRFQAYDEIVRLYPGANADWLTADYESHCRNLPDNQHPTVQEWIEEQPASYLTVHGVRRDPDTEPSRDERMRCDFAAYRRMGGVATFETWALRYGDDYPEAV